MTITIITPDEELEYKERSDFMPACRYGKSLSECIVPGEIGALVEKYYDSVFDPETGLWCATVEIKERLVVQEAA